MEEEISSPALRYFYPAAQNNDRKKTDVPWLVAYALLTLTILCAFFYSFILQKEINLFTPEDPDGRRCGQGSASEYPYIYFVSPVEGSLNRAVCVKECPNGDEKELKCLVNSLVGSCKENWSGEADSDIAIYNTNTNSFLSLCRPNQQVLLQAIDSMVSQKWLMVAIQHVFECYLVILLVCPLTTLFIVFLYTLIIHRSPDIKPFYILIIVFFNICLLIVSAFCFSATAGKYLAFAHILGYILASLTVINIIYLIRKRFILMRGLELMNIAARYIRDNKALIVLSIVIFAIWTGLLVLQVAFLIYIYSIDAKSIPVSTYTFPYGVGKGDSWVVKTLLWLSLIHYIWTNFILYHCGKYICRAASSNWIMHVPNNFKSALFTLVNFHMGSVLMGSAMVTLLSWLSSLLYFIMPDSRDRSCCCTWPRLSQFYQSDLFGRWLGFFSEMNYLMVSLDGVGFCSAGRKMTPIYVKSVQQVDKAYFLAQRVSLKSKLLVAISVMICCELVIAMSPSMESHVASNIIIFLFSFLLSSFAFDSYDKSFETLLLTMLLNKYNKMNLLDKVGMAKFTEAESTDIRNQVYRMMEEWYEEERELEAKDQ